jgi:hypothetical protein
MVATASSNRPHTPAMTPRKIVLENELQAVTLKGWLPGQVAAASVHEKAIWELSLGQGQPRPRPSAARETELC